MLLLFSHTGKAQLMSKPRKGEGIQAFLRRHQLDPAQYQKEFMELNKGKLKGKKELTIGESYVLPSVAKKKLYEPLFGKEREHYDLESNVLSGAVFYLVSGHGGPDPGAIGTKGNTKIYEDEYAYDITLRLGKKLRENGATVHFIIQDKNDGIRDAEILAHDKDETCMGKTIPLNQKQRLKQRTKEINHLSRKETAAYERCIIIHLDSRSVGKQLDIFFYHHIKSQKGREMAKTISDKLEEKYKKSQPDRKFTGTVVGRNLYIVRYTSPVALFAELGNIQNKRDQQRFIKADNRQAIANWLYEGIKEDFDNQKK